MVPSKLTLEFKSKLDVNPEFDQLVYRNDGTDARPSAVELLMEGGTEQLRSKS